MHLFFHTVFALLASTANSEKSSSRSFGFAGAAGGLPPGKNCGHCEKHADAVGLRCHCSIDCIWLVLLAGMLFKLLIFNNALIPYKA